MELVELTKLEENRKLIDNSTDTSSSPSTPSYSYYRFHGNTYSNTYVVLIPHFDTSTKKLNGASDLSTGANYVAPDGLDKSTNHHGNSGCKYNDDSR